MRKAALIIIAILLCSPLAFGADVDSPELAGISRNMTKKRLTGNWGFPAKRERQVRGDTWFYLNDNTPNPTDGILVYFDKGRVKEWKPSDNIYIEMIVWGAKAGSD